MIAIKEQQTLVTKQLSYNFGEATDIGRRHFGLSEEYKAFELSVQPSSTEEGVDVLRASIGHEDITIDEEVYVLELPLTIEFALSTGQLKFDIPN